MQLSLFINFSGDRPLIQIIKKNKSKQENQWYITKKSQSLKEKMKTLKTTYTSVAEVGTGHRVSERKAKT